MPIAELGTYVYSLTTSPCVSFRYSGMHEFQAFLLNHRKQKLLQSAKYSEMNCSYLIFFWQGFIFLSYFKDSRPCAHQRILHLKKILDKFRHNQMKEICFTDNFRLERKIIFKTFCFFTLSNMWELPSFVKRREVWEIYTHPLKCLPVY